MSISPPNFEKDDVEACLSWLEADLSRVVQLEDGIEKQKSAIEVHAYYSKFRARTAELDEDQRARMVTLIETMLTKIFNIPFTANTYIIEIEGADVKQVEEAARDLAEKIAWDRGDRNWKVRVSVRDEKVTSHIAEWKSGVDDG